MYLPLNVLTNAPPLHVVVSVLEEFQINLNKDKSLELVLQGATRQVQINNHNSLRIRSILLLLVVGTYFQGVGCCVQGCH